MATNEIQFFDSKDFSKGIIHRLRLPGIAAIELSKAPGPYIAAFVPESKVLNPNLSSKIFWQKVHSENICLLA